MGHGEPYRQADIPVLGPTRSFSTGGLGYTSLRGRLTELAQGQVVYLFGHLLRLWRAIPSSQHLPPDWEEYYGDVRAGSVRGGVRGSEITEAFLAYEARQAQYLGMPFKLQREVQA